MRNLSNEDLSNHSGFGFRDSFKNKGLTNLEFENPEEYKDTTQLHFFLFGP